MEEIKQEIESILDYLKVKNGLKGEDVAARLNMTRMQMYGRIKSPSARTVRGLYEMLLEEYANELRNYKPKLTTNIQSETEGTPIQRLTEMEQKYVKMLEERAAANENITRTEFVEMMNKVLGEIADLREQIQEKVKGKK